MHIVIRVRRRAKMNMRFVDLHCDTLLEMYSKNRDLAELDGHIDLAALRQGGALMQCFAAFLPTYDCAQRHGVTLPPYELYPSINTSLPSSIALFISEGTSVMYFSSSGTSFA